MNRLRLKVVLSALGLCLVAGLFAALVGSASSSAARRVTAATVIVTAGKPSELAFKLSKLSNIPAGPVTFKVTNVGKLGHTFEICLSTSSTASANKCKGKGKTTPLLQTGKSSSLTVTMTKGVYEFLCTVPGHASSGMKGLLGVGVKVSAAAEATATPTSSKPSTSGSGSSGSGSSSTIDPKNPDGCAPGTQIPQNGGDDDPDNEGYPTDGDGCI